MRPPLTLAALLILTALLRPAAPAVHASGATFNTLTTRSDVLTLRVQRPGVVAISGAALARAGWDLAQIDPRGVHLFYQGIERPLALEGTDDALLPSSTLRFMAVVSSGRFADAAAYWLTHDMTLGLRAPLPTYAGEPLRWEEATRYEGRFGAEAGDHWFSRELFAGRALSAALVLPAALPSGATLRLRLLGEERRAHALALSINGTSLPAIAWSDADAPAGQPRAHEAAVALPAAVSAGELRIDLTLVSAGLPTDVALLDWIELPEARLAAPELIDPPLARRAAHDLRDGPAPGVGGADYLIVSHADFIPALGPLLEAKRRAGRSPAIVDVHLAYDAWSYGERDPGAIRELLRAAMRWEPAPRAVLLVGAGSVRSAPLPGKPDENFIPPFLIDADPWLGEIACDTCYARLDTDDVRDDPLPNLPLGRFPVRTLDEAATLVHKTVAYETAPPAGPWRESALFLADNDTLPDGSPDTVGGFVKSADAAASLAEAAGLSTQRLYYDPLGGEGRYADAGALRCALFAAIDGAGGCSAADGGRQTADRSLSIGGRGLHGSTTWPTINSALPEADEQLSGRPNGQSAGRGQRSAVGGQSPSGVALLTYIGHGSPWQ